MREVVTLQFGERANYLATHWWNIQESYFTYPTAENPNPDPSPIDHDINFRPGIGADGSDTYTPRTLIYDFQQNFGGLRKLNALYDTVQPDEVVRGLWDGIQTTQILPPIIPNAYQTALNSNLPLPQLHASQIRYWSDFNRLFYHPRSIQPIPSTQLSSSTPSLNTTETFASGLDLYRSIDIDVDILDRDVRPWVEECDSLSMFQVFLGGEGMWGGFSVGFVEALREEYGKKGIWCWCVDGEGGGEQGGVRERTKMYARLANGAKTLRGLSEHASAVVRMSGKVKVPGYVDMRDGGLWESTALLCAGVESVGVPSRLRGDRAVNPAVFEELLNVSGDRNVWRLKMTAREDGAGTREGNGNRNGNGNGNVLSGTNDPRIRSSSRSNGDQENDIPQPSTFDIDFTPSLPRGQSTFPSLAAQRSSQEPHVFSQVESHRHYQNTRSSIHQNSSQSLLTGSTNTNPNHLQRLNPDSDTDPIIQIYDTSLPFPILDSYPHTLFNLPSARSRKILIDAALCTTSSTKTEVLALRDIVAGSFGRNMGLVDAEEVEGLYDDLTRLGEGYDYGWDGEDESGSAEE